MARRKAAVVEPTTETTTEPTTETNTETTVEPTPEPTPEPTNIIPKARARGSRLVKTEITAPVISLANITIEEVLKRKHDYELTTAEGSLKEIFEFLDRYEETMANSENVQVTIAESLQKQLYKNYLKIFGLGSYERGVAMEYLLWKFFRNEKRSFRVSNLSRFTRNGKWIIGELQMFLQLNNIFNLIKDPSDRIARLRTIQLGPTVKDFPSEKIQYTDSFLSWATTLK